MRGGALLLGRVFAWAGTKRRVVSMVCEYMLTPRRVRVCAELVWKSERAALERAELQICENPRGSRDAYVGDKDKQNVGV